MAQKKVKLDAVLYSKAAKMAEVIGYASVDEFVTHLLEKEVSKIESAGDSPEEVERRLRGLGYIA